MNDAPKKQMKKKRFRSPPYPAFDLKKAVERTSQLLGKAQHHEVGISVLAEAWNMESVSGQVWRIAAALIQYGLLTDSGVGKSRKFKVSTIGRRIVKDADLDSIKRKEAVEMAALCPMIHKELWDKFQTASELADSVVKTYLTLDRADDGEAPYSETAAEEVLQTYRATLGFAGISDSDSITEEDGDKDNYDEIATNSVDPINVVVGNHVNWTSNGVDQFKAQKVKWVSDDGSHLRVFGSPTGIPMSEVEIVDSPAVPQPITPAIPKTSEAEGGAKPSEITVYQVGGRLQITADVDVSGIEKLEKMLEKYKEILNLMN